MRKLKLIILVFAVAVLAGGLYAGNPNLPPLCLAYASPQNTDNYMAQGGATWVVGGTLTVSGTATVSGTINVTGDFKLSGTAVTASAAELNYLDGLTAGTVTASKFTLVSANKDLGDFRNLDCQNLDAGASGTAGTVDVFPGTESKGKIAITAADNAADHTITIVNASHGQATTYTIPDAGVAAANIVASTNALTLAEVDVLDAVTAGTVAASKALVVDASRDIATIHNLTGDGLVSVEAELSGGANVSHLIKKTNPAGETYSGTEAGLTIKAYDEDATVVHGSGENAGLAVFFKPMSDSGTGGENVIATFHKYAGAAGTVKHGVVIYGDMTNGLAISGGTSDYCLNFENQTASVADIKASTGNAMAWSSAAPSTGTWKQGDIVWNTGASAGGTAGWICTTGGTPGTWKTFGTVDS